MDKKTQYIFFVSGLLIIFLFAILLGLNLIQGLFLFALSLLGLLMFFRPLWALIILLITRPAIDLWGTAPLIDINTISLNYNSLIGLLVFVAGIAYLSKERKRLPAIPSIYLIVSFILLALISLIWSPSIIDGLREFIRISGIFIIFAVSFLTISNKSHFKILLKAFIISSLIPLIVSIIQYFTETGEVIFGEFFKRLYGSFFYPNSLAFFLVFIIAILLFQFSQSRKIETKFLYGLFTLIIFLVLLGTYTRGAWLGGILVFLVFGLVKFRKILLGGVLLIVLMCLFVPIIQERVGDVVSLEPFSSLFWRIKLWQGMIDFFMQKPILGHGLNAFQVLSQDLQGLSILPAPEAHNDYLKLLIELGIAGFILYFAINIKLLIFNLKNFLKNKDKFLKDASLLAVILVGVFILMAFGDNIMRGTATEWCLFAYLGGLAGIMKVGVFGKKLQKR
ncbi:MAG: O-antigen ligase family protein [Candidatus Paceibacterota bacterium]